MEIFSEPFPAWEATACQGKHRSYLKGLQAGKSRETTRYLEIDMIMIIIKGHFPEKNMHLSPCRIIRPGSRCTNSGNLVGVLQ